MGLLDDGQTRSEIRTLIAVWLDATVAGTLMLSCADKLDCSICGRIAVRHEWKWNSSRADRGWGRNLPL